MDAKKGGLGLVKSRRFGPLFATQFLGAFNDNVFKTALFVMIGFYGLGQNGVLPAGQMLNLGALLFILPYFLFSALSGQLGNKFDKAVLARWVKVLEIIIMAVAAYGFYIRSAPLLLLCLFCMGAQSTLFGPLKYAILPDYLDDNELMMGNSLIESGTFVAILFGQILGT
ncbi:TPA: MFS transporter, partial [Neisseria gonorrhoeae]